MPGRKKDSTAVILWTIMGIAIVGLLTALVVVMNRPSAKGDLGCLDGDPGNKIAILVDKSDPFTPAQQDELERHFEKILSEFQVNDLVSIFLLNEPDAMNKKPVFAHCVPQRTASSLNAAPKKVEERFRKHFGDQFQNVVHGSIQSAEAETSPILEMIRRISRSSYFREEAGKSRKLYVISDMMQHVGDYSFLRQPADFDTFKKSDYGKRLLEDSNLQGVTVDLKIIPRQGVSYVQMQSVKKFWVDYLRVQGAESVNVSLLP